MEAIQEFLNNILPLVRLTAIFLGAYAVLLWAASVLWAYRDIRRRTEDVSVQVLAVGIVSLLPFLGIPLHLILRPPETLAEKYERTSKKSFYDAIWKNGLYVLNASVLSNPILFSVHIAIRSCADTVKRVVR